MKLAYPASSWYRCLWYYMPCNTAALAILDNSGISNGAIATYIHLIVTYAHQVEYKSGFIELNCISRISSEYFQIRCSMMLDKIVQAMLQV